MAGGRRSSTFPVRSRALLIFVLLVTASLGSVDVGSAAPVGGTPTTFCGDSTDGAMDTGAGTMITCDTTVTNTITAIDTGTGVATGSSVIHVVQCTGPASGRLDPTFLTCTADDKSLPSLVTNVQQCNGVGYGGGNVLKCNVQITNTFSGVVPEAAVAVTVNQCNDPHAAAPAITGCSPFPASAVVAQVQQCNDSSYGGGQEDFICSVTGTSSPSLKVTVHQCNNSNYGGGSWLTCSTSFTAAVEISITLTGVPASIGFAAGLPGDYVSGSSFTLKVVTNNTAGYKLEVTTSGLTSAASGKVIAAGRIDYVVDGVTKPVVNASTALRLATRSSPSATGGDDYSITPMLAIPFVAGGTFEGTTVFVASTL
ncbi:MAG: hypothetical protein QOH61_1960 [Chloroflexota bacterium]|jgi:hypothetical protein|nr:hypothetical protein [Chloroflexota bacterium]